MVEPTLKTLESPSINLRVKPFCKPDVQLKKSRQRIFNENSIDLIYSFGYQCSSGRNLSVLKHNVIILISGNYLNLLNIDTMIETFLPSVFGGGFSCVTVHPKTCFFAAGEKGTRFCINIFKYPALEACKMLKNESSIMPCCAMQFHPSGDLLITLSFDPENRVSIWQWEFELLLFASEDSELPVYNLHFSTDDKNTFIISGKGHVTFWSVSPVRDERELITEIVVTQNEEHFSKSPKLDIYCTVSVMDTFLSATSDGCLLLWNSQSLSSDDVINISMPENKACHEGCIYHVIVQQMYIITFGCDGYMKYWDFREIIKAVKNFGNKEESMPEEISENDAIVNETKDSTAEKRNEIIYINPIKTFLISVGSYLVYGIINNIKIDVTSYLIQDKNGVLFQAVIRNDLSNITVTHLLSGVGCNIVGLTSCPVYPFVAVASNLGTVIIYDCVVKEVFKFGTFPVPITCITWPSAEVDLFASSLLIGFLDGTLRWIAFAKDTENYILKFVTKPHINAIQFLNMNDSGTILISQGLDSKLFFFLVENFSLIPLGFYINHHEVINFIWLKHNSSPLSTGECKETLLMLCKYSYLIETEIPVSEKFKNLSGLRKTYFIENEKCQVYKINGLRKYHELGDRIYDSDCEEESDLNEAGKEVLRKLKYEEKKEIRESYRSDLGFCGPVTSPEILSYLSSSDSNHVWLSLSKEDFGYIFEFEFQGMFLNEPIELIPLRALEILTADITPVLSMQYSPCGKFIFMGMQDGSLNMCYLEHAFMPSSGYDFAKYQIHDSDVGAVDHMAVSFDGSFITTAGGDGNILLFHFNMFDYNKTAEGYGEKPFLIDTNEVEDISFEKLSVEDELKYVLNEKYHQMKEQSLPTLETLKEEYLVLTEQFNEYSNLCKTSLKRLKCLPEELKLNLENFSAPAIAIEMFSKATEKLIGDDDVKYQKDFQKATSLKEKYYKYFKSKVEHEKLSLNCCKGNILSTFRGCKFPQNIRNFQLTTYPKMHKLQKIEQVIDEAKKKSEKESEEKLKLNHELALAYKAVIDYPSGTAVSQVISKYNRRKEERIRMLSEHIREHEILEKISIDDKMYNETMEDIQASVFKFKDTGNFEKCEPGYMSTFAEKKTRTALYYQKVYELWKFYNSLVHSALEVKSQIDANYKIYPNISEENAVKRSLMKQNMHIYFKKGKTFDGIKAPIKVEWMHSSTEKFDELKAKESSLLNSRSEKLKGRQKMYNNYTLTLMAAKPNLNCEKKFYDTRFNLKCMELNAFKTELMQEKKWLKIIKELDGLLYEENLELSALEEKMLALKNQRQLEKIEWMNIYNQFCKCIGLKHKHKGYFKQVFRKKIRPNEEKEPFKRHPSSESSESEQDIDSEDDNRKVDKREVDQELLREVMNFRLKRHEVEKRMKEYKRKLITHFTKEAVFQRRIQRIKDSLAEAWKELSLIPANRKLKWESMNWPVILYPENVHKEFFGIQISYEDEHILAIDEMSQIHETIIKQLKPINRLISVAVLILTDRVIKAELSDLIDIALVFFPLVDTVAMEVDEYLKKYTSPDSSEALKKKIEAEEQPVNIISEILSVDTAKPGLSINTEVKSNSEPESASSKTEKDKKSKRAKNVTVEGVNEALQVENIMTTDILLSDEKIILKSWRDVCDDIQIISPKEKTTNDFDINSIIARSIPTLDCSFLVDGNYSSCEDYYMQEISLDINVEDQKMAIEETGLDCTYYAKMLIELDIVEVMEDILCNIAEEELSAVDRSISACESFPTYPGGGLVLTRDVLASMEKEDPDSFPYTKFYQELEFIEELVEKPEEVHIVPCHEETELLYKMSPLPFEDFILLNIKCVLNSLKAFQHIRTLTSEYEEQVNFLGKKLLRAKNKRINVEQELLAVNRERDEEMDNKFSSMVNLDHLQDVMENPHLHIKRYESNLKIDSLKNDLKKLKVSEVIALKSLDKFGFEDTVICHELLKLRREFKFLSKSYFSKL